jgi:hypothetical protein
MLGMAKRKVPPDYVCPEPATFSPIVMSDEAAREWEEKERRKRQYEASPEYQLRLRQNSTLAADLMIQMRPFIEQARRRNFLYFRSLVDYGKRDTLKLQFADGKGSYYVRSVSVAKLAEKHGIDPDMHLIDGRIYHAMLDDGFGGLDHGMQVTRVRATS